MTARRPRRGGLSSRRTRISLCAATLALCGVGPATGPLAAPEPAARGTLACPSLPIPPHPAIQTHVERWLSPEGRPQMESSLARSDDYLDPIRDALCEEGLPPGLVYLVLIESGFDHRAESPAGARGLWQMKESTARSLGLRVEEGLDERLDPRRSTRAAAAYLRYLHDRFQSWDLALAAYNAGEGRVRAAMAAGETEDFWSLRAAGLLPLQTREYVPKFYAAVRVVRSGRLGPG
ncbi:MAG: lytic transglycosylase domain-containing protein [Nitrospirae bacterium]|nr:lytic transglycosylase domain-containing protein [Nitrospirota bacterium]